ncbi:MAG TPA: hypothetical protein VKN18_25375 [Blastocatellia bacterium]|nr:hypothetical protein [Blastocatellia bacterium]
MKTWVMGCSRLYRRVARAFPHEFRMVCGDGLEQLGADIVPMVWREQGILGPVRCLADLAVHLVIEYVSIWTAKVKELTMTNDLFEGTWKARNDQSQWDPNYTPEQACLRFEATDTGYLLVAYGIKDGQAVAERPTPIVPDGRRRPVVDLNGRPIPGVPTGAVAFGSQPDPHTIEAGAEVDGKVLGRGIYKVAEDGQTMTVTTEGMGLKGPFKVVAVFERVVPDPYKPQA